MSLAERVERAGNGPGTAAAAADKDLLRNLRGQVYALVPVDELALMATENPERARNEVRSACRRAFEAPDWAGVSAYEREQLVRRLLDAVFGFGIIEDLLDDETVTEVVVNGPSSIFFERDGRLRPTDLCFADEADLRALIDRMLGPVGRRIDEASPMVNARLPQGYRLNVVVPPVAPDGPLITIRKFRAHIITLEEMVESGSVEPLLATFLTWAVRLRKSIAVVGGTGSGKTTLLNALSCKIDPEERIVTIEDSAELRFHEHPDVARLEARPRNAEGTGEVTIRELVANALRMRPDRIVVGECRGAEALDMLQAMNTGHDGSLTTLHANSPAESIARLETMVRFGADLPVDVIEANIASAIHLVVQTRRMPGGTRRVTDVVSLAFSAGEGRCKTVPIYTAPSDGGPGAWASVPDWIGDVAAYGVAGEEEVDAWRRACLQQ